MAHLGLSHRLLKENESDYLLKAIGQPRIPRSTLSNFRKPYAHPKRSYWLYWKYPAH